MSDLCSVRQRVYVFADIETTGLDLVKHGIIQIGSWATGETESEFYGYFVEDANPLIDREFTSAFESQLGVGGGAMIARPSTGIQIEQQALDVNGFTLDRIEAADALNNVLCRWASWIARLAAGFTTNLSVPFEGPMNPADERDVYLVFHNAQFDSPRLQLALARAGLSLKQFRRVLCTVTLGWAVTGKVMSQNGLLEHFGLKNHMGNDALGDAYGCSQIFHAMRAKTESLRHPMRVPSVWSQQYDTGSSLPSPALQGVVDGRVCSNGSGAAGAGERTCA